MWDRSEKKGGSHALEKFLSTERFLIIYMKTKCTILIRHGNPLIGQTHSHLSSRFSRDVWIRCSQHIIIIIIFNRKAKQSLKYSRHVALKLYAHPALVDSTSAERESHNKPCDLQRGTIFFIISLHKCTIHSVLRSSFNEK